MTPREIIALTLSGLSGFLTSYGLSTGPLWLTIVGILIFAGMYTILFLAPTWPGGDRS